MLLPRRKVTEVRVGKATGVVEHLSADLPQGECAFPANRDASRSICGALPRSFDLGYTRSRSVRAA